MINPINRKAQTERLTTVIFLLFAIIGSILFYIFRFELLGGLGLGCSLFGLVSWFHFRKRSLSTHKADQSVESRMTWFLLGLTVIGIIIVLLNVQQKGPDFYSGIAAGLAFTCAVAYVCELLHNWFAGFR